MELKLEHKGYVSQVVYGDDVVEAERRKTGYLPFGLI